MRQISNDTQQYWVHPMKTVKVIDDLNFFILILETIPILSLNIIGCRLSIYSFDELLKLLKNHNIFKQNTNIIIIFRRHIPYAELVFNLRNKNNIIYSYNLFDDKII